MRKTALVVLMLALMIGRVSAQEQRGSIEGNVKDPSGAALPGVTIEAQSPALVGVSDGRDRHAGHVPLSGAAPRQYRITAALQGFTSARLEDVTLELGQILKVDLSLAVGGVSESVEVTGESPLIDVKQNAAATSISAETIVRIPKGRDFTSLVAFNAPGANDESRNGGIQIDGASGLRESLPHRRRGYDDLAVRHVAARPAAPTSSKRSRSSRAATTPSIARPPAGSSAPSRRAAAISSMAASGTYFTNDALLGDLRPSLRLNPTTRTSPRQITMPRDDISRGSRSGSRRPGPRRTGPGSTSARRRSGSHTRGRSRSSRTARPRVRARTRRTQHQLQPHRAADAMTCGPLHRRGAAGRGAPGFPGIEPDGTSRTPPPLSRATGMSPTRSTTPTPASSTGSRPTTLRQRHGRLPGLWSAAAGGTGAARKPAAFVRRVELPVPGDTGRRCGRRTATRMKSRAASSSRTTTAA